MCALINPERFPALNRPAPRPSTVVVRAEEDSLELQERRRFYERLGKPELAEKYSVFDVPEGLAVRSVKETSKGLEVTFYDPYAQAVYMEKGRESREFFQNLGYPQYGGKYEPFSVPEGHKVSDVKETGEGLQVTFVDVEAEAKFLAEQQKSQEFFQNIGYPQYGGKYEPFAIPEGHQVGEIKETDSGLQVSFYDRASLEYIQTVNPQLAGISRNYQEYLLSGGLARLNQYARPATQTVIAQAESLGGLPRSDYWTFMPSPDRPTYTSLSGATAIVPPTGYRVTNIQPSTVEMVGPLQQGQTRPVLQAVSYSLEPLPSKSVTPQTIVESEPSKGFLSDLASGLTKIEMGKRQSLPGLGLGVSNMLTPSEKQAVKTTGLVALTVLSPIGGHYIGLGAGRVLAGEAVSVGLSQGFKAVQGGGLLTPEEVLESAAIGGTFSVVTAGVFKGIGAKAPRIVESPIGRTSLYAGLGAGGGYVFSGGNIEEAGKGALFGAALGLASEVAPKIVSVIRERVQPKTSVSTIEYTTGPEDMKVPVYVSEPIKELGGKRVRVVGAVTEKPVGSQGVTRGSMIKEYVGKEVPTAHATLTPESFNLKAGGKTVLKGFPEMSKGFRSSEQLYHFYSAPGSEEYITVYGGYAGIGKGYSGTSKVMFGGKPTALVTLDTQVSPEFLRLQGESQASFLTRISSLSGKTGLAPETLLGRSMERQLITPASYERFGTQLPGSMFVSEGKAVTLHIKTEPTGILGRIPILRTLFADYTSVDIVKGRYAPIEGAQTVGTKTLDVAGYSSSYGRIVSVPKTVSPVSPSTIVKTSSQSTVPTREESSLISEMQIESEKVLYSRVVSSVAKSPDVYKEISRSAERTREPSSFASEITFSEPFEPSQLESFASASRLASIASSQRIIEETISQTQTTSTFSFPKPSSSAYNIVFLSETDQRRGKRERQSLPFEDLYGSVKKVYPILTGLEALTGGRKREKRVSKTKKTKKR